MDPKAAHFLLVLSLSSLLYSISAICVPRNTTIPHLPSKSSSLTQSSSPTTVPPASVPSSPSTRTSSPANAASSSNPNPPPVNSPDSSTKSDFGSGSATASASINPIARKICEKTDNPNLCLSAIGAQLHSIGRGSIAADLILELHIKATKEVVNAALVIANRALTNPFTPPGIATAVGVCVHSYTDALDQFQSALDAMRRKDKDSCRIMLSAALSDFSSCTDVFMETPGLKSPLSHYSDKLMKHTSNCLAIGEML